MMVAALDAVDALGATLTAGAPLATDGPDFAAMIATVGRDLVASNSVLAGDQATMDAPTPVNAGNSAKSHTKVTPRNRAIGDETEADPETPMPKGELANMSQNRTYLQMSVDLVGANGPAIMVAEMPLVAPADAPTGVVVSSDIAKPVDTTTKQPEAEKPKRVVVDDPAILIADLPVVIANAPQPIDSLPPAPKPRRVESLATATVPSRAVAALSTTPVVLEVRGPVVERKVDLPEPVATVATEPRMPPQPLPMIEKAVLATPERIPVFAVQIADVARDVLTLTKNDDVRFNVRPETLGPLSVTIERGDAGPSLRLGADTPAQVLAVRQAEPMLNDTRGGSPFVQVTVDLNSPESRGKPSRAAMLTRHTREQSHEIMTPPPVTTGRYA